MDAEKVEKVVNGLELCTSITPDGCLILCPYKNEQDQTYSGFCEQVLKRDALSVIRGLQAEIPKWILVTDRLPQDDEDVLVWVNGTHRDMAYRDEGVWYDEEHNHLKNITHWMPLPKPPKEGEA